MELVEAHNNETEPPVKEEEIGSEASRSPEPEWYLEQFRVHFGTIQGLFEACPPQQWETLSLALGDALDAVGKGYRESYSAAHRRGANPVGSYTSGDGFYCVVK